MKKVLVGAVFAAGVALAAAAPATAAPGDATCQTGCTVTPSLNASAATGAPWTDFFAAVAPWEKVFDPAGDGQGAWEQGVQAVNGGVWERVFPPAP